MSIAQCAVIDCKFKYNPKTSRRGYCCKHYMSLKDELGLASFKRSDATAPRPPIIEGNVAKIPLGMNAKDGYAIVDAEMAWIGKEHKWSLGDVGYAVETRHDRKRMQYFVLERNNGLYIDHINGDRLDNRRSNLRLVTHQQNMMNVRPRSSNGYKGVSKVKKDRITPGMKKVWRSYIKPQGHGQISLGMHETPEEAAKAYDEAARKYFGEFAYLNFP